jgi:hypothetical protein
MIGAVLGGLVYNWLGGKARSASLAETASPHAA